MSTDVAIQNFLSMLNNQLGNLNGMIETQAKLVEEGLNTDADDYNQLASDLENANSEIFKLKNALQDSHAQLEEADMASSKEINQLKSELTKAINLAASQKVDMAEFNRLKSLNPDGLRKKKAELSQKLQDKTQSVAKLQKSIRDLQHRNNALESELRESKLTIALQNSELEHLRTLQTHNDGDVDGEITNGNLSCFIYRFGWNLTFMPANPLVKTVSDFPVHFEIRTNRSVCAMVVINHLLHPLLPNMEPLIEEWPDELIPAITRAIRKQAELSDRHAWLVDRRDWAASTLINQIASITEDEAAWLSDTFDLETVFDLLLLPPDEHVVQLQPHHEIRFTEIWHKANKELERWTEDHIQAA